MVVHDLSAGFLLPPLALRHDRSGPPIRAARRQALRELLAKSGLNRNDVWTFRRPDVILKIMAEPRKRATVYLDPTIHKALRIKSAETDRTISELVNEALRASLAEDADDLEAFEVREREPDLLYEEVVRDLRRRGKV
jgi:hypothetical protein